MVRERKMTMARLARLQPGTVAGSSRLTPEEAEADRLRAMEETKAALEAETALRKSQKLVPHNSQPEAGGSESPSAGEEPEGVVPDAAETAADVAGEPAASPSESAGAPHGEGQAEQATHAQDALEEAAKKAPPKRKGAKKAE